MIAIQDLAIQQGEFEVSGVNLVAGNGEYAILMGPTGCGKTSILEAICGLKQINQGKILLDNQDVTNWLPAARQVGYVPQDAALFPTMRVDRQIEFGMEMRKFGRAKRRQRIDELAELLQIGSILKRTPHGLSGGEKQRVALARAISFGPRLLCLDEPLSSLDDSTRMRLTDQLAEVHRHEQVTFLHVTHNQAEADRLGTVQFRMQDGIVTRLQTNQ